MKLNIKNKTENQLIGRLEMTGSFTLSGTTPKRTALVKAAAQELKAKPELTIVRKLEAKYGGASADFTVYIYKDLEQLKKVEREYMIKRNELPAEPEPAAKEEAEEKPAEEKKETAEKPEAKAAEPEKKEEKAGDQ